MVSLYRDFAEFMAGWSLPRPEVVGHPSPQALQGGGEEVAAAPPSSPPHSQLSASFMRGEGKKRMWGITPPRREEEWSTEALEGGGPDRESG